MTVFIDTAVLMYAGGQEHPLREPCRRLLGHVEAGRIDAVTSAEVVQEIFHRFLAVGRPETGADMARAALDLFAPVLSITHAIMLRMPELVSRHSNLSSRDLIHAATCLDLGIGAIVSPDRAFDNVTELTRIGPGDTRALAVHVR